MSDQPLPSRRQLLLVSAAALLTAGCEGRASAPSSAPQSPSGPVPSSGGPVQSSATNAAGPPDWPSLASGLKGTLTLPDSSAENADRYNSLRLTENPRFDAAMPLAVLSAAAEEDVAAAVQFAVRERVPLAVRSGGHGYRGYSAGGAPGTGIAPSLVLDTRPLAGITVAADGTATIGAGASLVSVYAALANAGRALAAGSCPTVGITGLALGGGVGVLTRAYGLTCDALTGVRLVTADGRIRTADANNEPDLFWACRGGGGGLLGVVTSLSFATQPAPVISTVYLQWDYAVAAAVIQAWQNWAPQADTRLWSTLKLLGGSNHAEPLVQLSGTWTGPAAELDAQFAPLHAAVGSYPLLTRPVLNRSYLDVMLGYAGCASTPVDQCHTGTGGALQRGAFSGTSHVPYRMLDAGGVAALLARVQAASAVPGLVEGGVSLDALGGAVAKAAPDATAFVHRQALATVQYTATYASGVDPAPFDAYVRGSRAAMVPSWGNGAYVNYADASIPDSAAAYFGVNAGRLKEIKATVDPDNLFNLPQGY
ncbi:FAD-binding oxidoreductase [Paeniglutamicibacter antarcticus]|uniref:FAD-binding oxidoreductase n=1 Tax=Arthrobacter terrae TaxID=2935737 RepID=A0A931G424_9MICC|nr:FAD-binding protein [Arthrobacter terrae]MBG0739301.1 FAD-binding oxidoreductase [Arthrobacter terrae]